MLSSKFDTIVSNIEWLTIKLKRDLFEIYYIIISQKIKNKLCNKTTKAYKISELAKLYMCYPLFMSLNVNFTTFVHSRAVYGAPLFRKNEKKSKKIFFFAGGG